MDCTQRMSEPMLWFFSALCGKTRSCEQFDATSRDFLWVKCQTNVNYPRLGRVTSGQIKQTSIFCLNSSLYFAAAHSSLRVQPLHRQKVSDADEPRLAGVDVLDAGVSGRWPPLTAVVVFTVAPRGKDSHS